MRITTTRALALAAALTVIALGPVAAGPVTASYAGQTRSAGLTGAPTVGTCSTMTAEQGAASSDHSTVVDCSLAHTAQVAGVVSLPPRLQWSTATEKDLFRAVAARCLPHVDTTLGRDTATRDSSAYQYVWFEPTKADRDAGARWLSCSVVRPKVTTYLDLPTATAPFLPSGALPDKVARCLTRSGYSTPCAAGHLWRATGTFVVSGSYPGQKVLNAKALSACKSRVVQGRAYRWTYRDRITWNVAGDHVVVCYSRTRS